MADFLFAYGTLQPGLVPATMSEVAAKLTPIGTGFVRGVLYNLGRYPGAVADANSQTRIMGSVLKLPPDAGVLALLDAYEGFDPESPETSEYIRERQMVELADGGTLACWFYRYNLPASASQIIEGGAWRE